MEMKKGLYLVLIIVALFFASALPVQARGHGHFSFGGGVWIGPGWGGWGPWWWGAPAYPYYYDYYWPPPVVNQEQSQVYVEPAPQVEEQSYWYFCPDSRNYYPYVKRCPSGWLKVVPPPAPADWGE
jgi:hypothetical protein